MWLVGTRGVVVGAGLELAPAMEIGVVSVGPTEMGNAATTHGHWVGGSTTATGTPSIPPGSACVVDVAAAAQSAEPCTAFCPQTWTW